MKSRGLLPYGMSLRTADDVWKVLFTFPSMGLAFFAGNQSDTGESSFPPGILYGGLAGLFGFALWFFTRRSSGWIKALLLLFYTGSLTALLYYACFKLP